MFKNSKKKKINERFIFPMLGCYDRWCFSSTGNILSIFLIILIIAFGFYLLKKKETLLNYLSNIDDN
jgi:hypothetical protein